MSKKLAIASVLCIVLGSSSILSSPIINYLVDEMIEDHVDEILLAAKEEALPVINDIIDMINFVETVGFMYNPEIFAEHLKDSITILGLLYYIMISIVDSDRILTWFFDIIEINYLWYDTFSDIIHAGSAILGIPYNILGISEWAGEDLNFGAAKYNLIKGTDELPGICSIVYEEMNAYSPEGGWALFRLYDEAKGNSQKEQALADGYGTTWYKLDKLVSYYRDYYIPKVVPQNLNNSLIDNFFPVYGMTKTEMSDYFFSMQWANCLILPGGIDLSQYDIIPGAPSGVLGLEAGYPKKMEMNITKINDLWNTSNPYAIVNDDGNRMWRSAEYNDEMKSLLCEELNLTTNDMDCMIQWRVRLINEIIPVLGGAYLGLGMDLTTFIKSIQIGLMLFGISFSTLGSVENYRINRFKRKTKKKIKKSSEKNIVKKKTINYKGYTYYK